MNDGPALVARHLAEMSAMSRREWPPIVEVEGYEIIADRAYQGFDGAQGVPGWPEPRFWCRNIEVRRVSDGAVSWGIGPQADAYAMAIRRFENER